MTMEKYEVEDWVNYFTKELNLSAYEEETLLHDINNGRADEWFEVFKDYGISSEVVKNFENFIKKEEEEEL